MDVCQGPVLSYTVGRKPALSPALPPRMRGESQLLGLEIRQSQHDPLLQARLGEAEHLRVWLAPREGVHHWTQEE